jgi:ureidoglycolate lyase
MSIPTVTAQLLTSADFEPFGQVIQFDNETVQANQGTARRRNYLAELWNGRPETATPNMCIFRVQPAAKLPFPVRLLERHPHSTQAFIPMGNQEPLDCRYLVIVCSGGSDGREAVLNIIYNTLY